MSTFEEFFDNALDILGDIVEAGSVILIDKAVEVRACGVSDPVSALGETVAKIFDVDLDDVYDC